MYVDGILVTGSSLSLIQTIIAKLQANFSLKQLGQLDYFLGLEVKHLMDDSILMTQTKYICDLLHKINMAEAYPISSPMVSNCKLFKQGANLFSDPTLYRSFVGALQYATLTRPEIAFVVNKVCQFMANPLDSYWVVVKRILGYLKGTMFHGLHFQPVVLSRPVPLTTFCDVD